MNIQHIIPVTDLRRNFGAITEHLASIDELLLTRGGEPFATIRATPNVKRKILLKACGAWKKTAFDDDRFWKRVIRRSSRRHPVDL